MPIESIQCPKCGSPLQVQPAATSATCTYCGSHLRVTRGASGHPLAVLGDIKDDTAIIAKQTAIDHLRRQLRDLLEERGRLENEKQEDFKAVSAGPPSKVGCSAVMLIVMGATLVCPTVAACVILTSWQDLVFWLGVVVLGVVTLCAGLLLQPVAQRRDRRKQGLADQARRQIKDKYGPLISDLDDKIGSTQARISELETDIDRLAREL